MTDREIIVAAYDKIILALEYADEEDVADIARGMFTVTVGYHDAFAEIRKKVGELERFSVRADLLEPQPKDDGYHERMAAVYDMREKAR